VLLVGLLKIPSLPGYPLAEGCRKLIQDAYKQAGIDPKDIDFSTMMPLPSWPPYRQSQWICRRGEVPALRQITKSKTGKIPVATPGGSHAPGGATGFIRSLK
jgi:hypothetical protein